MTITLDHSLSLEKLQNALRQIRTSEGDFSIYDALYPSPSDPGAYFNYSSKDAPSDSWNMTLGNHGWSGGIYVIPEKVLEVQLMNLSRKKLLSQVKLEGVTFRYDYKKESAENNQLCVERIKSAHKSNGE